MENSSIKSFAKDWKLLPPEFYSRGTVRVASELLGKLLIVADSKKGKASGGRIVETEAYHGDDPASHSARGRTPRSEVMFGPAGCAYVYFIYGMYEMLNFVTEKEGYPGAVLIRAIEPLIGLDEIRRRRKGVPRANWTNGPGRLCRALGIRLMHNRMSLQGPVIGVFDDGFRPGKVLSTSRIGISRGLDRPWRMVIDGHADVSKAPRRPRKGVHGS